MTKAGYDALLKEVCGGWDFCGCIKEGQPLHVDFLIPPYGPVTADQFVEWVFLADSMNPNFEPERWQRHKNAIRQAFVEHMGAEVVDASKLRHDFSEPQQTGPDEKYRGPLPDWP